MKPIEEGELQDDRRNGLGELDLGLAAPIATAPLFRDQVYRQLREAILTGALPPGTRVSPAKLATQLGVSTMPIREALRQLAEAGLVEMSARRWTRVASPDWALADEVYPILGLLEEHAIVSGTYLSADQLERLTAANEELRKAVAAGDVQGCLDADRRFHDTFTEASSNSVLQQLLGDLKARLALLEGTFFQTKDGSVTSLEQHQAAIDAAAAGDLEPAGAFIRANWRHGLEGIRRAAEAARS